MTGSPKVPNNRHRSALWRRIARGAAWLSAFVVGVAGFATALVTIAAAFPKLIPFLAPFDASILIRDIRVEKARPIVDRSAGSAIDPAAEVNIEYVEEKTGPSTLRECRPELKLQDVYQAQSWPARSQKLSDSTQAKLSDTFIVPRGQYAKEGSLRMVCEGRITGWSVFSLPEVVGINKPQSATYYLCMGQYREACGANVNWIPCGGSPAGWAKSAHPTECVKTDIKKLSDVGGNQCGYATFQIACTSQ